MSKNKFIHTKIKNYIYENKNIDLKAYRGVGNRVNYTYNGSDEGMGIFYTDNLIMAKWFAGLIEFNIHTSKYEKISDNGKVIQTVLNFNNPYIINSDDEDYDSFQMYMDEIKDYGGVDKYKEFLYKNNHDGVILKNNNTNYYQTGTYDIYIVI